MGTSDGRILGTQKIVDRGSATYLWNLVILGDGYQESEMNKYHTDVNNFIQDLQGQAPFDDPAIWQSINIYRVDVASNDSGADDPQQTPNPEPNASPFCQGGLGTEARTYFDASYCFDGQIRRLLSVNESTALMVASDEVPEMDQTLVY